MRVSCLALVLLWLPCLALAQGFAGLGETAEGFALPQRDHRLSFPADHGAHPDFRIEWWYITATLTGADGADYGVQWTLFRSALRPETEPVQTWRSPQIWLAHAALTTNEKHYFAERLSRGGIGTAGANATPFSAWIDDWSMTGKTTQGDSLDEILLTARGRDFAYALDLVAEGPLVLHGDNGFSVKSHDGQASHYYSQPFYAVTGDLQIGAQNVAVTGQAWLDREWSSQPLSRDQQGWDWLALGFHNGARLMVAQVRGTPDYRLGSWITADGSVTPLASEDIVLTPLKMSAVAGPRVPVEWRVDVPRFDVSVEVVALNPDSWMGTTPPYWEGPVSVSGSHSGRGYLEMTGYEEAR